MILRLSLGVFLISLASVSIALNPEQQLLINRVKPLGAVRVEGEENNKAAPVPTVAKATPRTGEQIYMQYCTVCHATGVAGAPKFRDAAEWSPRLAQKGINGLVKSVTTGLNAMPPMGTCQTCTQEDFKLAIEYMLPKS